MKPRVLFVDDEPMILHGLRRMLHKRRAECDIAFAGSGAEALELLSDTSFDALVSDMRMPGMDGCALLNRAADDYPHVARFVLSGQAEAKDVLDVVGAAHQFLAKPCDVESLNAVLDCARNVSGVEIARRSSSRRRLPSPRAQLERLRECLAAGQSVEAAAAIIADDVAMTAQTLRVTRSAFFGRPSRSFDCAQVVAQIGLSNLGRLVDEVELFRVIRPFSEAGDSMVETVNATAQAAARTASDVRARSAAMVGHVGALAALEDAYEEGEGNAARMTGYILDLWGLSALQPDAPHAQN